MAEASAIVQDPGTYVGTPVLDYVKPAQLVDSMIEAGASKGTLPVNQMFVRGMWGGALLAYATAFAFLGVAQGIPPILAGALFPLGFMIINTIQADLATGYFCYVPLAFVYRRISFAQVCRAFFWVYIANLAGSLVVVFMLWAAITMTGATKDVTGISGVVTKVGELKTLHYEQFGFSGALTCFIKGMLCNWMVTLGVVLPLATRSTLARMIVTFVPIYLFFGMGWEHAIVNMFIIPSAILYGAPISMSDWWIGNELPATLGNFAAGFVFTGLGLGWTYYARKASAEPLAVAQPAAMPAL